jgi:hypothetical protein
VTVYRDPAQTVSDAATLTPDMRDAILVLAQVGGTATEAHVGCHPHTCDLMEDRDLINVRMTLTLTPRGAQVAQLLRAETARGIDWDPVTRLRLAAAASNALGDLREHIDEDDDWDAQWAAELNQAADTVHNIHKDARRRLKGTL